MFNSHKIVSGILSAFALVVVSSALTFAEGQAVSSPNGSQAYSGGAVGGDNTGALSWSVSLPTVNGTGLQIDGMRDELDDFACSGFGFQFFRRNEYGFFVVKRYGARLEEIDIVHVGLQGELYKGMLTLL